MIGFAMVHSGGAMRPIPLDAAVDAKGDLVWVHLHDDEAATHAWLRDVARLPRYAVDPLVATETRPRCDAVGDGAFINLRGLAEEPMPDADPLASLRIFAHSGHVFSVTRRRLTAITAVREKALTGAYSDPGDLITAFATAITAELDPHVAELGDTLDDCEEALDDDHAFSMRRRVNKVRIAAIGYRRFLSPQRAALEKLATMPGDWLAPEDRPHLAAAADRAARMAEELEAIRERAALIHETLTDLRAEEIDRRSLQISVAAMVFLPLTFITGLLGMNVEGIPYAREPWAFDGVVALCVVLAIVISVWFAWRHWMRR